MIAKSNTDVRRAPVPYSTPSMSSAIYSPPRQQSKSHFRRVFHEDDTHLFNPSTTSTTRFLAIFYFIGIGLAWITVSATVPGGLSGLFAFAVEGEGASSSGILQSTSSVESGSAEVEATNAGGRPVGYHHGILNWRFKEERDNVANGALREVLRVSRRQDADTQPQGLEPVQGLNDSNDNRTLASSGSGTLTKISALPLKIQLVSPGFTGGPPLFPFTMYNVGPQVPTDGADSISNSISNNNSLELVINNQRYDRILCLIMSQDRQWTPLCCVVPSGTIKGVWDRPNVHDVSLVHGCEPVFDQPGSTLDNSNSTTTPHPTSTPSPLFKSPATLSTWNPVDDPYTLALYGYTKKGFDVLRVLVGILAVSSVVFVMMTFTWSTVVFVLNPTSFTMGLIVSILFAITCTISHLLYCAKLINTQNGLPVLFPAYFYYTRDISWRVFSLTAEAARGAYSLSYFFLFVERTKSVCPPSQMKVFGRNAKILLVLGAVLWLLCNIPAVLLVINLAHDHASTDTSPTSLWGNIFQANSTGGRFFVDISPEAHILLYDVAQYAWLVFVIVFEVGMTSMSFHYVWNNQFQLALIAYSAQKNSNTATGDPKKIRKPSALLLWFVVIVVGVIKIVAAFRGDPPLFHLGTSVCFLYTAVQTKGVVAFSLGMRKLLVSKDTKARIVQQLKKADLKLCVGNHGKGGCGKSCND
ncbi:hypothetical protein HK102_003894 [Quaeritorhiza haematococci]|nr:hypothetical protein HK102_003894 [Quaeritorhiza haematococci]